MSDEMNQILNALQGIEFLCVLIFFAICVISRRRSNKVSGLDLARLSREYNSPVVFRRGLLGWGAIHASVVVHGRLFYCQSYSENEFEGCKIFEVKWKN